MIKINATTLSGSTPLPALKKGKVPHKDQKKTSEDLKPLLFEAKPHSRSEARVNTPLFMTAPSEPSSAFKKLSDSKYSSAWVTISGDYKNLWPVDYDNKSLLMVHYSLPLSLKSIATLFRYSDETGVQQLKFAEPQSLADVSMYKLIASDCLAIGWSIIWTNILSKPESEPKPQPLPFKEERSTALLFFKISSEGLLTELSASPLSGTCVLNWQSLGFYTPEQRKISTTLTQTSLVMNPFASIVASLDSDGKIYIGTPEEQADNKPHLFSDKKNISQLAFSPEGHLFAVQKPNRVFVFSADQKMALDDKRFKTFEVGATTNAALYVKSFDSSGVALLTGGPAVKDEDIEDVEAHRATPEQIATKETSWYTLDIRESEPHLIEGSFTYEQSVFSLGDSILSFNSPEGSLKKLELKPRETPTSSQERPASAREKTVAKKRKSAE